MEKSRAQGELPPVRDATTSSQRSGARIPSLDGFRAISIGLVMLYHLAYAPGAALWLRRVAETVHSGALGVRVFFAISGFLITALLLAEHEKRGTISLRRFYFRRTLRILPPYYVFLTVVMVASAAGLVTLAPHDAWNAWTFSMNFVMHRPPAWSVIHSWSLSIEEQFYLLWPSLLLLAGPRRSRPLLVVVMVLAAFWRISHYVGWTTIDDMAEFTFRGVADWLAAGSLLALMRRTLHARAWYARTLAHPLFPVIILAGAAAGWTGVGYWRRADVTLPAAIVGTVLLLDWAMTHPTHPLARPLNWWPVEWLGRLSYSLYLWQQLFLTETAAHWWERSPLNVLLALGAASFSYYLVERPVLDWRARLEPRLAWLRTSRQSGTGR
jgi:peptidoglycan/LPS O-acetylase OafA/YrhL